MVGKKGNTSNQRAIRKEKRTKHCTFKFSHPSKLPLLWASVPLRLSSSMIIVFVISQLVFACTNIFQLILFLISAIYFYAVSYFQLIMSTHQQLFEQTHKVNNIYVCMDSIYNDNADRGCVEGGSMVPLLILNVQCPRLIIRPFRHVSNVWHRVKYFEEYLTAKTFREAFIIYECQ